MSFIQRFFKVVLPRRWAASMEAESRAWKLRCPCGGEQSIWDIGGIRWKAVGNPKRWLPCPACGKTTWQTLYKDETTIRS